MKDRLRRAVPHCRQGGRRLEKYGVRDWWIELLFGTTHSVAVLLEPAP